VAKPTAKERMYRDPSRMHYRAAQNRLFIAENSDTARERREAIARLRRDGVGEDGYPLDYTGPKKK
jgi:hypothetical protein